MEHSPRREKLPYKKLKEQSSESPLSARNISPIPEGSRSTDSSHPRQSSIVSDPDATPRVTFRSWLLITTFSIHWTFSAVIFAIGLTFALNASNAGVFCHSYFVLVYLRLAFWVVTYFQHELIKPTCRKLVNSNYNLYLDMACYRKAPLQIVSFWNTMLLAVQNYVGSLFPVSDSRQQTICELNSEGHATAAISPQLFIAIFCGLETVALTCFYVPAIRRLMKSMDPQQEDDSPNRTLSNLDDIPINWRLKRQAEQLKLQHVSNLKLISEATELGLMEDEE